MTHCKQCNTFQTRLKKGGLCDKCTDRRSSQGNESTNGMNNYFDSSPFNLNHNAPLNSLRGPMLQQQSATQPLLPQQQQQHQNQNYRPQFPPPTDMYTPPLPMSNSTPISSSSSVGMGQEVPNNLQELYLLISGQINNLGNRISNIEHLLSDRLSIAENKLKLHDEEIAKKNNQIEHLSNTIINMQRSLNSVDSNTRAKNLIFAGIPENPIPLTSGQTVVESDLDKVNLILSSIGLAEVHVADDSCLSRIGKPTDNGRPRMLQMVCSNNETRESVVKAAPKLKEKGGDLMKIFINRDTHPVYQKESARLRQRLSKIKQSERELNNECDAKIIKGKLVWNGDVVDKNLFFH